MQCLKFFQQTDLNGLSLKSLIQINTAVKVQKVEFQNLILNIFKNYVCELQNDDPLAPDKIEIKREMFPNFQLKIADF